jgi:hypothetical protein
MQLSPSEIVSFVAAENHFQEYFTLRYVRIFAVLKEKKITTGSNFILQDNFSLLLITFILIFHRTFR